MHVYLGMLHRKGSSPTSGWQLFFDCYPHHNAALDTCRVLLGAEALTAWRGGTAEEMLGAIRNRFVTGDWAEGQRRSEARPAAGSEDDSDVDGEVRQRPTVPGTEILWA